jgi:hypothetical protein
MTRPKDGIRKGDIKMIIEMARAKRKVIMKVFLKCC